MDPARINRRLFLKSGASTALAAGVAAGAAEAREIQGSEPWGPHQADSPQPLQATTLLYFTQAEAAFVEAASERLIPADELGPGAKECGVTLFIDHQLAGPYGRAQSWYMQGPWPKGTDTQGFQSRYDPARLYRAAIKAIDDHVGGQHGGKSFAQLAPADQDQILSDVEQGKIELAGVDGKTFFSVFLLNTKEGMFADPIYGGNRNMAGWKMLGFPGARYDYRDWVERHGERYDKPPVSIGGRPAWTQKS